MTGNLSTIDKSKHAKTVSNPRGAGRPKGSTKQDPEGKRGSSAPLPQAASERIEQVPLADIKDAGAQMRVEMRSECVVDYAADMLAGATFPPVVVFYDGNAYWLGDGAHRVEAARRIEVKTISAEVRAGSARDAILYGCGSNAAHGLRRTAADKRRAIERLLKDPEWAAWSDRKIGEATRTDGKTVAKVRRELTGIASGKPARAEIRTANGKQSGAEIRTGNGSAEIRTGKARPNLVDELLRSLSDDILIAECQRRGLTVGGAHGL